MYLFTIYCLCLFCLYAIGDICMSHNSRKHHTHRPVIDINVETQHIIRQLQDIFIARCFQRYCIFMTSYRFLIYTDGNLLSIMQVLSENKLDLIISRQDRSQFILKQIDIHCCTKQNVNDSRIEC